MKYSKILGKTRRDVPHWVRSKGLSLLFRAGFIRTEGEGLFAFLPLGEKTLDRLKQDLSRMMIKLDGQEVTVPFVSSSLPWEKSGRSVIFKENMIHFQDNHGRSLVLSPSHEESMVELVRSCSSSYRDLPLFLFQFQLKFRDYFAHKKARTQIEYPREFLMKDAYSFHLSYTGLNNFFPQVFAAYRRMFKKYGLQTVDAERGVGFIGGLRSYGIYRKLEKGPESILQCASCGYRAHEDVAVSTKNYTSDDLLNMEKIETPQCNTYKKLFQFMGMQENQLTINRVYKTESGFVLASIRADYEISTAKLSRAVGKQVIRLAGYQELLDAGLVPGYLSPIGVNTDMPIVVDDTVAYSSNLVFGANEEGYHYRNVNFGLDFEVSIVADIARIRSGDFCVQCGQPLERVNGLLIGTLYKLGDLFTRRLGLIIKEERRGKVYPQMGSYGLDLFRLIVSIVEENADERGIVWPGNLAPFPFYLMSIGHSLGIKKRVEEIASLLGSMALFDDRGESISTKFKDCDLLGIPYRIIVSKRYIQEGKVEFLERKTRKKWLVKYEDIEKEALRLRRELEDV